MSAILASVKSRLAVTAASNVFGAKGQSLPPRLKKLLSKIGKALKAGGFKPVYAGDFEGTPQFTIRDGVSIISVARSVRTDGGFELVGPSHGSKGFKSYLFVTPDKTTIFSIHGWSNDKEVTVGLNRTKWRKKNADLPVGSILSGKAALEAATGLKFKAVIERTTGKLMLKANLTNSINKAAVFEALIRAGGKKKEEPYKGKSRSFVYLPDYDCEARVVAPGGPSSAAIQLWIS